MLVMMMMMMMMMILIQHKWNCVDLYKCSMEHSVQYCKFSVHFYNNNLSFVVG